MSKLVLRLPHDEPDRSRQSLMANPDSRELLDAFDRVSKRMEQGFTTHSDVKLIMHLAGGYIAITSPLIGEEGGVKKLRDIFVARKAKKDDA